VEKRGTASTRFEHSDVGAYFQRIGTATSAKELKLQGRGRDGVPGKRGDEKRDRNLLENFESSHNPSVWRRVGATRGKQTFTPARSRFNWEGANKNPCPPSGDRSKKKGKSILKKNQTLREEEYFIRPSEIV